MNRHGMIKQEELWAVDGDAGFVEHISGLRISFKALPETGYFEALPHNVPDNMTSGTLSRLIRLGFDEFKATLDPLLAKRAILVLKVH